MRNVSGVLLLLIYICVAAALLTETFTGPFNLQNLIRWSSLYAIIGMGAAFTIITAGIDLSIGSMIGLIGCSLPMMLAAMGNQPGSETAGFLLQFLFWELLIVAAFLAVIKMIPGRISLFGWQQFDLPQATFAWRLPVGLAIAAAVTGVCIRILAVVPLPTWFNLVCIPVACLVIALHLGLAHGLLITKLKLQPFIVTLCGLMIYRGVTRNMTGDRTQGFGDEYTNTLSLLAVGKPCTFATLLAIAGLIATLWAVVRMIRQLWGRGRTLQWSTSAALLVVGVSLAVIGSSRFWRGYEIEPGAEIARVFGQSISTWSVNVEREDQKRPAAIMQRVGFWMIGPGCLWLAIAIVLARRQTDRDLSKLGAGNLGVRPPPKWRLLVPLIGMVLAYFAVRWATNIWYQPQPEGSGYWLHDPAWDTRLRMTMVLAALACLFGMVGWFAGGTRRLCGDRGNGPLLVVATAAIFLLAGQTPLVQTKVQTPFFFMLGLGLVAHLFLNHTIYGRYLFALGHNEQAARFSGINTDRMVIAAYVICAFFSGVGGILFALDANTAEPSSMGNFSELYAIAAAVLGGCSLRGGEGSILGVILGASVMRALINAAPLVGIPTQLEMVIVGATILVGVVVDELVKRAVARRRARVESAAPVGG